MQVTRSKVNLTAPMDLDMTPMIDVVFQLVLFFMLVNDMSTKQVEQVRVPVAATVKEYKESQLLIVNVKDKGEILINSQDYSDETRLTNLLGVTGKRYTPAGQSFSDVQVIINADRDTEFRHVQKVMMACLKNKIWKVSFSAKEPGR